jgi:hypothetical protein
MGSNESIIRYAVIVKKRLASLNVQIDYLPNPSGVTLLAGYHNPEGPFGRRKRMTIPSISEKDNPVRKVRIELWESEQDLISIRRIDNDVGLHLRAAEPFSKRRSCALQEFKERNALVDNAGALVVGNRHTLAW